MPTPRAGYYTRDGKRVPGTTTILARFKESGGLIHWSWNIAHEGLLEARALLDQFARGANGRSHVEAFLARPLETWDYRAVRDKAADAGTVAHEMVECFIRRRDFDASAYPAAIVETARPAFEAFREWAAGSKLEPLETEVGLVSEKHRYGGTLDAMMVGGKLALGDWKTSNAIYPEYLCQLAAYGILWEENHADYPIDGGFHLLRFSKQESPGDPVQFTHYYWSQLDLAREAFLKMRELYDLVARLGKMAK